MEPPTQKILNEDKISPCNFSKSLFNGCHINTSKQIQNEAIEYIFETLLVRSDEVTQFFF